MDSNTSHLCGEIALDISLRIRTHFESDSREQWELGHKLFQQELQGVRFWLDVQQAIRKQAKKMGVPARKLETHDIVLKMEHCATDLQGLEPPPSKDRSASSNDPANGDEASKIPGFVTFMRKYVPSEDTTWDIWKYVLERRIKPALVRGSQDASGGRSISLDLENNPPTVPATDPTDDAESVRSARQLEILNDLNPTERAIFLMSMWSLQTQEEKDIYRSVIIQAGAERCYKQDKANEEFSTLDHWIAANTELFRLAEEKLTSSNSEDQIRAVELQESISLHYHAAASAEQAKSKFAGRFLAQGGKRNLLPVSTDSEDEADAFAVEPLSSSWQSDAKALLLKICQQAVESESKDKFNSQFQSVFPLTMIYKDYKPNQGAPTRQNNALWMLMRFGGLCQSQSYHLNAYRSKETEFAKMNSAIGFSDDAIGQILGMRLGTVAVRRNRYRAALRETLGLRIKQIPDKPSNQEIQPTIDVVCSDYAT
jgi:hypothetical protein